MANDDFTPYDEETPPEGSAHAPEGEAVENPFYTEVSSGDLVLEDGIVFDEPLEGTDTDAPADDPIVSESSSSEADEVSPVELTLDETTVDSTTTRFVSPEAEIDSPSGDDSLETMEDSPDFSSEPDMDLTRPAVSHEADESPVLADVDQPLVWDDERSTESDEPASQPDIPAEESPEFTPEDTALADESSPADTSVLMSDASRTDDSTWQEINRRRSLFEPRDDSAGNSPESAPVSPDNPVDDIIDTDHNVNDDTVGGHDDPLTSDSVNESHTHTTTIPVASVEEIDDYAPGPHSGEIPVDVLSVREKDGEDTSTTAIRRDLLATPPSSGAENATTWHHAVPEAATPLPAGDTPQKLDDAIFEGATVIPVVPSRVKAHFLSLLLTLLLAPISWYFFADAGARMTLAESAPISSGQISLWALLEFALGIIGAAVIIAVTVRSSLGAWVSGVLVTLIGLPWLFAPAAMMGLTQEGFDVIATFGAVGRNFSHHAQVSAYSGRLLLLGLALWAIGIVSHSVRRRGRADEVLRAEVERVNPAGAHLTWSARRRAAKEAARQERSSQ